MSLFCQATKTFIKGNDGDFFPEKDINLIKFEESGTSYIPETIWEFDDPTDPTMCYYATFGATDLSGYSGEIQALKNGGLIKVSKDPAQSDEQAESLKPDEGMNAQMIIVGCNGKCTGMFGLVCHEK